MKKALFFFVLLLILPNFGYSQQSGLYEDTINYTELGYFKVDKDGFMLHDDPDLSFKWKAYVYLPNESHPFGFGPFLKTENLVVEVKDIAGELLITDFLTDFDGKEGYELVQIGDNFFRRVNDKKELTLYKKVNVFSFLGNNFFEPPVPGNIKIGPVAVNRITLFIPNTMTIWDWSSDTGFAYKISEHTIYSTKYDTLNVIYFDPLFKAIIQVSIALLAIIFSIAILKWHNKIPKFNFQAKYFFALSLIALLLMVQLGFIVQNPNPVDLDLRLRAHYEDRSLQYYLGYLLGFTDSVDSLTIRNFSWCEPEVFNESRNIYLITKSADKIYIPESLKEEPRFEECMALLRDNVDEKKIEFISEEEIDHETPFFLTASLFDITRRIIYSLFLLTSFLITAYIVLKAFEIKGLKNSVYFALILMVIAFGTIFFNLITAFLAQLPVTYHGASTLPLTMSAKFLPFFNQGHIIRLVALAIGGFFVFIFSRTIRRQISVRVFLFPMLILTLMLLLPQTEFSTKRAGVGLVCGICGVNYIGKLDAFNLQTIYKKIRDDRTISDLFETDRDGLWRKANSLKEQGRAKEAAEMYELYLLTVEDATVSGRGAEAALKLAEIYKGLRMYDKAIEVFKRSLRLNPQDSLRFGVIVGLADAYKRNRQEKEAILVFEEIENTYSEEHNFHAAESLFWAAQLYERIGELENARYSFDKLTKKYPDSQYFTESGHRVVVITDELSKGEN